MGSTNTHTHKGDGRGGETKREKGKSLILGNYLVKPHFIGEETDPDSDMVCSSLQTKEGPSRAENLGFPAPGFMLVSTPSASGSSANGLTQL